MACVIAVLVMLLLLLVVMVAVVVFEVVVVAVGSDEKVTDRLLAPVRLLSRLRLLAQHATATVSYLPHKLLHPRRAAPDADAVASCGAATGLGTGPTVDAFATAAAIADTSIMSFSHKRFSISAGGVLTLS